MAKPLVFPFLPHKTHPEIRGVAGSQDPYFFFFFLEGKESLGLPGCLWPHMSPITLHAACSSISLHVAFAPQSCVLAGSVLLREGPLCPRSLTDASTVPTAAGGRSPVARAGSWPSCEG